MQPYHLYTARDFALDEDFQQWVLKPDVKSNYQWDNWLKQYPEKKQVIEDAIQLVRSIQFRHYEMTSEEKGQLWDDIWKSIAIDETAELPDLPVQAERRRIFSWKYAAAVLLGVLLGTLWLMKGDHAFKPVTLTISTLPGETKRLFLPDSSEVVLNAGSRLVYTQKATHTREVWLEGEAWFHVHHTKESTGFIVHAFDRLAVEVLGTQFNVNNFGNKIAVVLQEGSIKLNITETQGQHKTQLYLHPGEILTYNKEDGEYAKNKIETDKATAWTYGVLRMEEYTVADAIQFMAQVFDQHVSVKDPKTLRYSVSGSMPIIYNADTMLIQFEKAFKVRFYRQDNSHHVRGN